MQPTLKINQILSGKNYRKRFKPAALKQLEEQIKAAGGVLEPIIVREHPTNPGLYEIIAGERRWRAAGNVYGQDYDMPVVIREATDAEARALGIIENNARDDPSEIEEAEGAAELLAYNKGDKQETALQLGWDADTLNRRLLLLHCVSAVREALMEERIKLGHAELLAGLPQDKQEKVLAGVIEHKVPVETLKKQLGQFAKRLADAVFDTSVCLGCQHNSAQQAALFDESIGDGFCQHPTHYEELTLAALEERAKPLREQYQVVKFVRIQDGFSPLTVAPDGPLGVGAEQFTVCKGCESFGCSMSAMPGSYGEVEESLCFDAACNSKMVATHRKAQRATKDQPATTGDKNGSKTGMPAATTTQPARPKNQVPAKVIEYRVQRWRKWAANALMAQPEKNQRFLIALVLAGDVRSIDRERYTEVATKAAGFKKPGSETSSLRKSLEQTSCFDAERLETLVQAAAAAAAYGVAPEGLELLLNYLDVDESKSFVLGKDYIDLLTVSEMESLAEEVGLKKAMGDQYQKAKAGKRGDFLTALLVVKSFTYTGCVPKSMRYARRKLKGAAEGGDGGQKLEGASQDADQTVVTA